MPWCMAVLFLRGRLGRVELVRRATVLSVGPVGVARPLTEAETTGAAVAVGLGRCGLPGGGAGWLMMILFGV